MDHVRRRDRVSCVQERLVPGDVELERKFETILRNIISSCKKYCYLQFEVRLLSGVEFHIFDFRASGCPKVLH